MTRETRLDDGQTTDPQGHGANAGSDEEKTMSTPPRSTGRSGGFDGSLDADELLELGHGLSDLGRVDEAFEYYTAAGALFAAADDLEGAALVDMNIGIVALNVGEYERALDLLTAAAEVFVDDPDPSNLHACWLSMGPALRGLRRFDEARMVMERLVDAQREAGDPELLGHALVNLGNLLGAIEEPDAARECYLEAMSLYRNLGLAGDEAVCLSSLGALARDGGQFDLAASLQARAIDAFAAAGRPCDVAIAQYGLAITCLHLRQWAAAKELAESATGVSGTDLDPALVLSVALDRLGDTEGAERERLGFHERNDEATIAEELEVLP